MSALRISQWVADGGFSEEAHLPGLSNGDRNTVRIKNAIGGNAQHSTTRSDDSNQVEWVRRAHRD